MLVSINITKIRKIKADYQNFLYKKLYVNYLKQFTKNNKKNTASKSLIIKHLINNK